MTTANINRYRKDNKTIFIYSEERRRNIGKAREKKLDLETISALQAFWNKRYVPERWLLKTFSLSRKVYTRYKRELCPPEQIKFLPQHLSPEVFEFIIDACRKQTPYVEIANSLGLEQRMVKKIIEKLAPYYEIGPVTKPRYVPNEVHRLELAKRIANYNKQNPKRKEQNPNWKGGITELCEAIRRTPAYHKWRKTVLARDSFKCIICAKREKLQVDHIYPFSLLLDDGKITSVEQAEHYGPLWNIANGRTMCESCHRKTETYGRQRTTKRK